MTVNFLELHCRGLRQLRAAETMIIGGSEHYTELLKNNLGTNIGTDIGGSTYDEAGIVNARLLRRIMAGT
jgi:hypothetical protein